jgi:hypothetical protein
MGLNKIPTQRRFENTVQREYDELDNLRTDTLIISFIVFTLSCLIYSLFS